MSSVASSKKPPPASILSLIVAQPSVTPADASRVCLWLDWCRARGHVRHAIVYEPSGALLGLLSPQWREAAAESAAARPGQHPVSGGGGARAEGDPERAAGGRTRASSSQPSPSSSTSMQVHVISAADAMKPLLRIAAGARGAGGAAAAAAPGSPSETATPPTGHDPLFGCALSPREIEEALAASGPPWAVLQPELAFVFGPVLSLSGFPAWNIAHAEIYDMGALGGLSWSQLDASLRRFCKTNQRFGR